MIVFEHPSFALFALLPLLIHRLMPPFRQRVRALRVPFLARLRDASESSAMTHGGNDTAASIVLGLALALLLAALTDPRLIGAPVTEETPMRDLLIAVDLSGSMQTKDFTAPDGKKIERLDAVKSVLHDFLSKREGERVGLIFFGTGAFVQAPFTRDLNALQRLLDEARVGMAGPQTALGDAIGLAAKLFNESNVSERMLIVLSDGDDTHSRVPPKEAAKLAAKEGVQIFTIAIGDPQNAGEAPMDTETLITIAERSGGKFYDAYDRKELEGIYDAIDRLHPKKVKQERYRPSTALFIYPLGGFIFLLLGYGFWRLRGGAA